MKKITFLVALLVCSVAFFSDLYAQAPITDAGKGTEVKASSEDAADLAKQTQNPVSDLISVPFQYNLNFGIGPHQRNQDILNIQPVVPIHLNENWNVISRTIIPLIWQPNATKETGGYTFGLGDINQTLFLSPAKSGKLIWGIGPTAILRTGTNSKLSAEKWNIGPSAVLLTMPGNWVIGALVSQSWSIGGDEDRRDTQPFLLQYFVNYNMKKGWYLTSAPIITADWKGTDNHNWTVPIGGGVGKIFHVGKLPLNAQVQGFYNITHPEYGPDWSLRFQLQFLFPTGQKK